MDRTRQFRVGRNEGRGTLYQILIMDPCKPSIPGRHPGSWVFVNSMNLVANIGTRLAIPAKRASDDAAVIPLWSLGEAKNHRLIAVNSVRPAEHDRLYKIAWIVDM